MNRTDMFKDAQRAEEYGVDPDTIMVTYTLDEYAQSHGDEVDTFDEDKLEIRSLIIHLQELDIEIQELMQEIEETQRIHEGTRNWAERYEANQEIRELSIKLLKLQGAQQALLARKTILEEQFENKYAR